MRNTVLVWTAALTLANSAVAQDLILTGVIDGPLTGGLPKAVEIYVINNTADISIYGIGSANNGGGTDGQEFVFPAVAATAGDFIYVASESAGFTSFFGFAPDYTSGAASINGDDAIEFFHNGFVADVFGDKDVDGSGQPWDYVDGWAYRSDDTGPDCSTFLLANWSFSGINALNGETTNDTATTPFPIGAFSTTRTDTGPCLQSTSPTNGATDIAVGADVVINFNEDVTTKAGWFDISCSISGAHTATVSGGPQSFTVDPDIDFAAGDTCTVWITGFLISDLDADDPPDNMPANFSFSFDTGTPPPDDTDGDGVPDDQDICPGGDDNVDSDGDFTPDDCDACPIDPDNDADGDGVCGDVDVCPGGNDTLDADNDGTPDACDACPIDPDNDVDGDGVCGDVDVCPVVSDNQDDTDGDLIGDACDLDSDNDGVCDEGAAVEGLCTAGPDNCPLVENPSQSDADGDGVGDACDGDVDGDNVADHIDDCPMTVTGEIVNADGCSVPDLCRCDNDWKNHGGYVRCVAHASEDQIQAGLITEAEKDTLVSTAAGSSCGSKK